MNMNVGLSDHYRLPIVNGRNDIDMMKDKSLRYAVIGPESAFAEIIRNVQIIVASTLNVPDIFLIPKRLITTFQQ